MILHIAIHVQIRWRYQKTGVLRQRAGRDNWTDQCRRRRRKPGHIHRRHLIAQGHVDGETKAIATPIGTTPFQFFLRRMQVMANAEKMSPLSLLSALARSANPVTA